MARRADWDMADDDDDFEIIDEYSLVKTPPVPLEASNVSHFEITQPSLVNNNSVTNEVIYPLEIPSLPKTLESRPVRYGSAVDIPYEEGFDLKSLLNSKPIIPSNDLMTFIHNDKSSKHAFLDNSLAKLLTDHTRARENLVQIARKTQQDLISAMNLD